MFIQYAIDCSFIHDEGFLVLSLRPIAIAIRWNCCYCCARCHWLRLRLELINCSTGMLIRHIFRPFRMGTLQKPSTTQQNIQPYTKSTTPANILSDYTIYYSRVTAQNALLSKSTLLQVIPVDWAHRHALTTAHFAGNRVRKRKMHGRVGPLHWRRATEQLDHQNTRKKKLNWKPSG